MALLMVLTSMFVCLCVCNEAVSGCQLGLYEYTMVKSSRPRLFDRLSSIAVIVRGPCSFGDGAAVLVHTIQYSRAGNGGGEGNDRCDLLSCLLTVRARR